MKKVIAGYFDYIIEKQKVEVVANVPVMSDGQIVFQEDKVTPMMTTEVIETEIDVRQRVWVPQREVDLTEEEIKQREIDDQEHAKMVEFELQKAIFEKKGQLMEVLLKAQTEALIMAAGNPMETQIAKEDFIKIKSMINAASTMEELNAIAFQ